MGTQGRAEAAILLTLIVVFIYLQNNHQNEGLISCSVYLCFHPFSVWTRKYKRWRRYQCRHACWYRSPDELWHPGHLRTWRQSHPPQLQMCSLLRLNDKLSCDFRAGLMDHSMSGKSAPLDLAGFHLEEIIHCHSCFIPIIAAYGGKIQSVRAVLELDGIGSKIKLCLS